MTIQQEQTNTKSEMFINVRKLVALDIAIHGRWIILVEFIFGVAASGILGAYSLYTFFNNPDSPLFMLIIGTVLSWITLNYIPMLLYAISIMRHKSALQEATFAPAQREHSMKKYALQSTLLLLPLIVPLLAIYQEIGTATPQALSPQKQADRNG